ncbi:uncharacterized protein PODANS_5_12445 [Podospora anserina S mat+]|uniref:Podospora anserina S mat+ genomic DNA chromosome 5, supercontig 7 n=1 Tax=Podospora anserina (strain S / ATCC MYA-4624 / DSM 980 / FGSC 10383) TaxID=515849 RepID=B2AFS3_PODAN|nr:uncharacterized protein PODANS_5_12445 [Podospora anserina S mat+]CAP62294.1 unnamed protein product [Podospora anserina S mat+]CDP29705.1 Putative protein of unknown function [Podospora anserina S mat+]
MAEEDCDHNGAIVDQHRAASTEKSQGSTMPEICPSSGVDAFSAVPPFQIVLAGELRSEFATSATTVIKAFDKLANHTTQKQGTDETLSSMTTLVQQVGTMATAQRTIEGKFQRADDELKGISERLAKVCLDVTNT